MSRDEERHTKQPANIYEMIEKAYFEEPAWISILDVVMALLNIAFLTLAFLSYILKESEGELAQIGASYWKYVINGIPSVAGLNLIYIIIRLLLRRNLKNRSVKWEE